MIFGKTRLELKVGIFAFIGLIILTVFVLSIGGFKTWTSGYHVNFVFSFVNGVKIGAPVRFAGVDVGAVKCITLDKPTPEGKVKVEVRGWVKNTVKIPVDSTIWVNTLGLLGEKYIEIIPGKNFNDLIAADESILGQEPMPMHEVTELAKSIASNINESVVRINKKEGTIGKLLYDDTIYNELEALIVDLRKHPWKLFWKGKEKPEKK